MTIKEFLTFRRQNDTVKLVCIFVLAGIGGIVSIICHTGVIYHDVNLPAEYVLSVGTVITSGHIDKFMEIKDVAVVSREMTIPVAVRYRGAETVIVCHMLTSEYLEMAYGIETFDGTKKYYMNEAAFGEFRQSLQEEKVDLRMEEGTQTGSYREYDISYMETDETASDEETTKVPFKSGKIVVIKAGMQKEPFICTADSGSRLSEEAYTLRVLFEKHDLDRLHVKTLKNTGGEIENEDKVITDEVEMNIELMHIRYGILLSVTCMVAAMALWHQVVCGKDEK